jgi:hypothetical protein
MCIRLEAAASTYELLLSDVGVSKEVDRSSSADITRCAQVCESSSLEYKRCRTEVYTCPGTLQDCSINQQRLRAVRAPAPFEMTWAEPTHYRLLNATKISKWTRHSNCRRGRAWTAYTSVGMRTQAGARRSATNATFELARGNVSDTAQPNAAGASSLQRRA